MEHLIPMTDFVIQILDENYEFSEIKMLNTIHSYALFQKTPLKLGYFIPCDENDVPLEEPKRWNDYLEFPESFDGNKEWYELYAYQEAKQRVLFEGFHIEGNKLCYSDFYFGLIDEISNGNIEDLLNELPENEMPKLTETAKKEIVI